MSDDAKLDRAVVGSQAAVVVLNETDWLADERFTDVDLVALPPDLAAVAHTPDRMVGTIVWLPQDAVEAAGRDGVMLGRGGVAQSLGRPFFVVETLEAAQALPLLSQAARRRGGRGPRTEARATPPPEPPLRPGRGR